MGRKTITFWIGISVVLLSIVCMLWYGVTDTGDGFQKRKEDSRKKGDTGRETKRKTARQEVPDWMMDEFINAKRQTVLYWQEGQEWVVTEDVQESMETNLSLTGRFLLQEEGSLFVAGRDLDVGVAMYGGKDVPEKENYNIYCLKDGRWEVFVSHPPESVNNEEIKHHYSGDETFISNLIYYEGFLYYSLLYDYEPGMGGSKMQYIYRIPIQGGEAEELALSYERFSIYNGKIYYVGEETGRRDWKDVCWEMEVDGTGRREIYRRKRDWKYRMFTVGGGCFYIGDEEGVTGVNLETGVRRYYKASWKGMKCLYYEDGYLYFLADYGMMSSIYRMNVVCGAAEQLADNVYAAWLENGYLYYTLYDDTDEKWKISILDLENGQLSSDAMMEGGTSDIQIVGEDLLIKRRVYGEDWNTEKFVYYRYRADMLPLERLDRQEIPVENP